MSRRHRQQCGAANESIVQLQYCWARYVCRFFGASRGLVPVVAWLLTLVPTASAAEESAAAMCGDGSNNVMRALLVRGRWCWWGWIADKSDIAN